jgi:16S rRNA G966 N2-methylase RsmD
MPIVEAPRRRAPPGPEPALAAFIAARATASDRGGPDRIPPAECPLTTRGGSLGARVYEQHAYWSKKPYGGIEVCLAALSRPGEMVLDPFCGSGSTLVAAVATGRHALGLDLSPAAAFIAAGYLRAVDPERLTTAGALALARARSACSDAYVVPGIGEVDGFLIADLACCRNCRAIVAASELAMGGAPCPRCGFGRLGAGCPATEWVGEQIVGIVGSKGPGELPAASYRGDEAARLRRGPLRQPIPASIQRMGRLKTLGLTEVGDLYSDRALLCLAALREAVAEGPNDLRPALEFVFSSILLNASRMYRVRRGGGGGPAGNYFVPSVRRDNNPLRLFEAKLRAAAVAKRRWNPLAARAGALVVNGSASDLSAIPAASVDYVFTDPPYSDKMPYGALNSVWEAWLGSDRGWLAGETIGANWEGGMRAAARELARVLKPGRWASLCYHDDSPAGWARLQAIFTAAGFQPDPVVDALRLETAQRPIQQLKTEKLVQRDLVVHFRKPLPGEPPLAAVADSLPFAERAAPILRAYLGAHPGATRDRAYDALVSGLLRSGQLAPLDFDGLLVQVAAPSPQDPRRWYLKDPPTA